MEPRLYMLICYILAVTDFS